MPQVNYEQPELLLGQIGTSEDVDIDSYVNELFAQLSEITVGGNDAGTYAVRIEGGGEVIDASYVADGIVAVTVIIAALITDLQAQLGFSGTATAVNNDPDLELTFLHTGIAYTITFPTNPATNMSVANSQDSGGTSIPLGIAMAQSASGEKIARLPTGVADVLLGISVRNINVETNVGGSGVTETEPGDEFSVLREGPTVVRATTAVTAGNPVFVRHAAATTAEPLGSMSATDDGNTVALPGARWKTTRTGAGLARVIVNLP